MHQLQLLSTVFFLFSLVPSSLSVCSTDDDDHHLIIKEQVTTVIFNFRSNYYFRYSIIRFCNTWFCRFTVFKERSNIIHLIIFKTNYSWITHSLHLIIYFSGSGNILLIPVYCLPLLSTTNSFPPAEEMLFGCESRTSEPHKRWTATESNWTWLPQQSATSTPVSFAAQDTSGDCRLWKLRVC